MNAPSGPTKTDSPATTARPTVKLGKVSMRSGPPGLLTGRTLNALPGQGRPGAVPLLQPPDGLDQKPLPRRHAPPPALAVPERPGFSNWQSPRPSGPADEMVFPFRPRTRHDFGPSRTDGETPAPPPIPAPALKLRMQRKSSDSAPGTRPRSPLQLLDLAVRARLWDQFPRPVKRPPSSADS